jgi:hypothetical protein
VRDSRAANASFFSSCPHNADACVNDGADGGNEGGEREANMAVRQGCLHDSDGVRVRRLERGGGNGRSDIGVQRLRGTAITT